MRDALMDQAWFDHWIAYDEGQIAKFESVAAGPSGNPGYRPQFLFDLSKDHLHLLLRRYGRGDPVCDLARHMPAILGHWEAAETLGQAVWTPEQQLRRHAWSLNLDHYIRCFWLVGLAVLLEVPDDQWQRLLALVGNEGEDRLLDRVIASRSPSRRIGVALCHPQPYRRLAEAVEAAPARRATLLATFVARWYEELDRPPRKGLSPDTAIYERPYWYGYDALGGGYFGYWCIEAAVAARVFDIDDSACLGHPHYPGDLLRPDGPGTHSVTQAAPAPAPKAGLAARLRKSLFG